LNTFGGLLTDYYVKHIGQGGEGVHALVTDDLDGFMRKDDYKKLKTVESYATADMTGVEITDVLNSRTVDEKTVHQLNAEKLGVNLPSYYEPAISKKTAFNKDFGSASGTICEGNDLRLLTLAQKNVLVLDINSNAPDCGIHYHSSDRKWGNMTGVPTRFRSDISTVADTNGTTVLDGAKGMSPNATGTGLTDFYSLGLLLKPWFAVYANTLYEAGQALAQRYLSLNGTAVDSSKLGAQAPSYYATATSVTKVASDLATHIGDLNIHKDTWRPISDSTSTADSVTSASLTAVKSAYDLANNAYTLANSKWAWNEEAIKNVKVYNGI
jgi:hypothetical protein